MDVVSFEGYRKDQLIEACRVMQASLRFAVSTGDESALIAAELYTKADVETIATIAAAGIPVAEAMAKRGPANPMNAQETKSVTGD